MLGNVPTNKTHSSKFYVGKKNLINRIFLVLTLFGGTVTTTWSYQLSQIVAAFGGTETDLSLWLMV